MRHLVIALFGAVLLVSTLVSSGAVASDMDHHHGVVVEQAWARATPGAAKSGAAYVTLSNHGDEVDRLIEVKSDLAARTEIHTHVMTDNVMKMMKVEGGVEIEPGSPTVFKPGGLHIMFMGLNQPFVEGETLPVTLVFEKAGEMTIDVTVQSIGAMEPMKMDHDHSHGS